MDREHPLRTILTLILVAAGIAAMIPIITRYDDLFLRPICQRYGAENNFEYVGHRGGGRRIPAVCTYRIYHPDGSLKDQFDVRFRDMRLTPVDGIVVWFLRPILMGAVLIPAVYFGRKLIGQDD